MENIQSYMDEIGSQNMLRNADFNSVEADKEQNIDKQKTLKEKIEGSTLPFELPALDATLGSLAKKGLVKAGLRSADDSDGIIKSLAKKGLESVLKKGKGAVDDAVEDATSTASKGVANASDLLDSAPKGLQVVFDDAGNAIGDSEVGSYLGVRPSYLGKGTNVAGETKAEPPTEPDEPDVPDVTPDVPTTVDVPTVPDIQAPISGEASESNLGVTSGDNARVVQSSTDDLISKDPNINIEGDLGKQTAETEGKVVAEQEGKTVAKSEGKSLAEKLAVESGEAEVEGGGPEDIVGDVVGGVLAVGALIASIFGKKIKRPDTTAELAPLQVRASQGFGLNSNS